VKPSKAVLLVGHGSRRAGFQAAMEQVARRLERRRRYGKVICAYLEIAPPSISEAFVVLAASGCREVRVLPYFLQLGKHVQEDLPKIVSAARRKHRRMKITLCPYFGYHDKIASVAEERLRETG
jgi:sirohydrochlorin cobaltochelatase